MKYKRCLVVALVLAFSLSMLAPAIAVSAEAKRPYIEFIQRDVAPQGYEITIIGKGFGKQQGHSYIYFTEYNTFVKEYTFWSDTEVRWKVPFSMGSSIMLRNNFTYLNSNAVSFRVGSPAWPAKPILRNASPDHGTPGTLITLKGQDFGDKKGQSYVLFGGNKKATSYKSWKKDKIQVKVPMMGAGDTIVRVVTKPGKSNSKGFRVRPVP